MTHGIHFEHTIKMLIIVPIASIHSDHVVTYITELMRVEI